MYFAQIGRGKRMIAFTLEAAAEAVRKRLRERNCGGSAWYATHPNIGCIYDAPEGGNLMGHVSYNERFWFPQEYRKSMAAANAAFPVPTAKAE